MSGPVAWFAENQPVTAIVDTIRALFAQQPVGTKRPVTHKDYDNWHAIQSPQISRDGKFVAYAFMPQDNDGEIVVRNVAGGVEWRAPRGYRPPAPPPDDPSVNVGEIVAANARLVRPVFTSDSRYVVFAIEPDRGRCVVGSAADGDGCEAGVS